MSNLVSGSDVFLGSVHVNSHGDIGALLLQSHEHVASLVVETFATVVVTNFGDHASHHLSAWRRREGEEEEGETGLK